MTRRFSLLLALALTACTGSFEGGLAPRLNGTPAEPAATGGGSAHRGEPDPSFTRCLTPGPLVLPRRLARLSNAELGRALSTVGTLPSGALPASFVAPGVPSAPDPGLAVSRDFLEQLSGLGLALAPALQPASGCDAADFGTDETCTREALRPVARRAFRGLDDATDVSELTALALEVGGRSGPAEAQRLVMRALAMSPKTLYLFEGIVGPEAGGRRALTGPELASYLSFRIDGRPPSDALLQALASAPPTDEAQLTELLTRTVGERALDVATQDFLSDWLEVPDIVRTNKDLTVHPFATAAYLRSLQAEDYARLGELTADRGTTLGSLLTGPQRSLAAQDDRNPAFATKGRTGVVSLPGVLAGASGMHETLIPRRGRFLLRRVLCESLAAPPANATLMTPPIPEGASERTKFELIEAVPSCGGCHTRIDKLAVPLETVDEVGRVREVDHHGHAIDTAGRQMLSTGEMVSYRDANDLYGQLSRHPIAQLCFGVQAFRHFSRLPENDPIEHCAGEALSRQHLAADGTLPLRPLSLSALVTTALAPRIDLTVGVTP
jgi:hypothetical protein